MSGLNGSAKSVEPAEEVLAIKRNANGRIQVTIPKDVVIAHGLLAMLSKAMDGVGMHTPVPVEPEIKSVPPGFQSALLAPHG